MSNKTIFRFLDRIISTVLLIGMVSSNSALMALDSNPQVAVAPITPVKESAGEVSSSDIGKISVPAEFGKIEDIRITASENKTSPVLIHIKNAHGSYEAQINIQKLIEHLVKEYDINTIFLEGAVGELNPDILHFFPNDELNNKIADRLIQKGELNGGELFLLKHDPSHPVAGFGAEDLNAYAANLKTFRQVMQKKNVSERFIRNIRMKIETIGTRIFNKNLRDFLKSWQAWREERLNLGEYLEILRRTAKNSMNLDLTAAKSQTDYPMLVHFYTAKTFEAKFNLRKVKEEKDVLINLLKKNSADETLINELTGWDIDKGVHGWVSEKSPRTFLEDLYHNLNSKGFRFDDYPNLIKFWTLLALQKEIDGVKFFEEVEALNQKIFSALAQSEQEKKMIELVHDSILLEKLLTLSLTRNEVKEVRSERETLKPEAFVASLANNANNEIKFKVSKYALNQVRQIFDWGIRFYDEAEARENHIAERVESVLKERKQTRAILVTGGYHIDGLREVFSNKQFSYVEVVPHISSVEGAEKIYLDAMLGTHKTIFDISQIEHLLTISENRLDILKSSYGHAWKGRDPMALPVLDAILSVIAEKKANHMPAVAYVAAFNQSAFAKSEHSELRLAKAGNRRFIQVLWNAGVILSVLFYKGKWDLGAAVRENINVNPRQNISRLFDAAGTGESELATQLNGQSNISNSEKQKIKPVSKQLASRFLPRKQKGFSEVSLQLEGRKTVQTALKIEEAPRSELRDLDSAVAVATVFENIVAPDANLDIKRRIEKSINETETIVSQASLSPEAESFGDWFSEQISNMQQKSEPARVSRHPVRRGTPKIILEAKSRLVTYFLLPMLKDKNFVEHLRGKVKFYISESEGNDFRHELDKVINAYDRDSRSTVAPIFPQLFIESKQSLSDLAKSHRGSAVLIEDQARISDLSKYKEVMITLIDWSDVKSEDRNNVGQILYSIFIGVGTEAQNFTDLEGSQARGELIGQLTQLGFSYDQKTGIVEISPARIIELLHRSETRIRQSA